MDADRNGFLTREQVVHCLALQFGVTPPESTMNIIYSKLGIDAVSGIVDRQQYDRFTKLLWNIPKLTSRKSERTDWDEFSMNVSLISSAL